MTHPHRTTLEVLAHARRESIDYLATRIVRISNATLSRACAGLTTLQDDQTNRLAAHFGIKSSRVFERVDASDLASFLNGAA